MERWFAQNATLWLGRSSGSISERTLSDFTNQKWRESSVIGGNFVVSSIFFETGRKCSFLIASQGGSFLVRGEQRERPEASCATAKKSARSLQKQSLHDFASSTYTRFNCRTINTVASSIILRFETRRRDAAQICKCKIYPLDRGGKRALNSRREIPRRVERAPPTIKPCLS